MLKKKEEEESLPSSENEEEEESIHPVDYSRHTFNTSDPVRTYLCPSQTSFMLDPDQQDFQLQPENILGTATATRPCYSCNQSSTFSDSASFQTMEAFSSQNTNIFNQEGINQATFDPDFLFFSGSYSTHHDDLQPRSWTFHTPALPLTLENSAGSFPNLANYGHCLTSEDSIKSSEEESMNHKSSSIFSGITGDEPQAAHSPIGRRKMTCDLSVDQDNDDDCSERSPKKKRSYFRRSKHSQDVVNAHIEKKKREKRERNRILAAQSRLRQKNEMQSLREENALLKQEINALRRRLVQSVNVTTNL